MKKEASKSIEQRYSILKKTDRSFTKVLDDLITNYSMYSTNKRDGFNLLIG
jgi:hypothetical protein